MDLNTLVATVEEKKLARLEAKRRYDSATAQSLTHGTDNYAHFNQLVTAAFNAYETAQNAYTGACRALLEGTGDLITAAYEEFEPAFNRHGDKTVYLEGQQG